MNYMGPSHRSLLVRTESLGPERRARATVAPITFRLRGSLESIRLRVIAAAAEKVAGRGAGYFSSFKFDLAVHYGEGDAFG